MRVPPESTTPRRLVRDRPTLALYATLGVIGFLLNGLGAVLSPLQRQLGVDRAAVAFYPTLFAAALIGIGLFGGGIAERLGTPRALAASLGGMAGGALLLGAPARPVTLIGAVLLGLGGALAIQIVPAALSRRHPGLAAPAIGEANAVSSMAAILAPAAVATALALGSDWRVGYLVPVLPVALGVLVLLAANSSLRAALSAPVATEDGVPAEPGVAGPGYEPGGAFARWFDVLVSVSVEFCLVFWAADAFEDWHGAGDAAAPALATAFLVGMAATRLAARRLTGGRHPSTVTLAACAVAAVGFLLFWTPVPTAAAALGLLVTGAGVALMYPVTVARLVAAWPDARDRAAARGALASGLAIAIAPLVLARLADAVGLRAAYVVVPILLAVLAGRAAITLARR